MRVSAVLALFACVTSGKPELRLDGPDRIAVNHLGPVDGPRVVLDEGAAPDGLILTLSRPGVARIEGNRVIALAPGVVDVVAEWEGDRVVWTLEVALETTLSFVDPPSTLRVGDAVALAVVAQVGERAVDAGLVTFVTSDDGVVGIDDHGRAVGRGPGTAYVTARAKGTSAMVEIEVTGP